jgi:hypothetical protein
VLWGDLLDIESLGEKAEKERTRVVEALRTLATRIEALPEAKLRDLIAAGRAEAEQLGMARELVRFERLTARLPA